MLTKSKIFLLTLLSFNLLISSNAQAADLRLERRGADDSNHQEDRNDDHGGSKKNKSQSKSKSKNEKSKGKLSACCDLSTTVSSGKFEYEIKKNEKNKLEVKVNLTVPDPALNIVSEDDALNSEVGVLLSRDNAAYAFCKLRVDDIEQEHGKTVAEFKLSLEKKGSGVKSKKGYCDIDLSTPDNQVGFPNIQSGDKINAQILIGSEYKSFLEGAF